jgi:hypothetical protein
VLAVEEFGKATSLVALAAMPENLRALLSICGLPRSCVVGSHESLDRGSSSTRLTDRHAEQLSSWMWQDNDCV